MTNEEVKQLCLSLLQADSEAEVVSILTETGHWQDQSSWRWLGDKEHNYSTAGNQQSRAEQALIEKLTNSIDAKLIAEARIRGYLPKRGTQPQAPDTPQSIGEARDIFFEEALKDPEKLSRGITVSATAPGTPRQGFKRPCFTIVDDGEGQTPQDMPRTILSISEGNKEKIKFTQGKFNMGGTGVLEFCGMDHNVQLVISKRHPELLDHTQNDPTASHWSFTIVRREDPPEEGSTSRFVYLAPVGRHRKPEEGDLLHFEAKALPIFPDKAEAYTREGEWGTLFKLYEYDAEGFRTGMLYTDGLMYRSSLMLPEPALPIRFHECRSFRGHSGSFDTTMPGLIATLKNDLSNEKRDNVEWYDEIEFDIDGEQFKLRVFLFKNTEAAGRYKKDEGLVFSYNGQCHATLSKDFFKRKKVNKHYLWHTLLVFVDCSGISTRGHEKLFMPGRDRLRKNEFAHRVEIELMDLIGNHEELRFFESERRKKEATNSQEATESMAKAIEKMLRKNSTLASLLSQGLRIRNPHKPESASEGIVGFIGKKFPTIFHLKGRDTNQPYKRDAHIGSKVHLTFETDAANDYFRRDEEPGQFELQIATSDGWLPAKNHSRPRPLNGIARMTLELPESSQERDEITFAAIINDPSRVEPFREEFTLSVKGERDHRSGPSGRREGRGNSDGKNKGPRQGKGREKQDSFLAIPEPILVEEKDWINHDPLFNKFTAVRIKRHPEAREDEERYDFYVNMGNGYLVSMIKENPKKAREMRRRFAIGMTLLSLSLLHQEQMRAKTDKILEDFPDEKVDVSDRVAQTTSAIAPFLLPIVESLSDITEEEEALSDSAGEAA